MNSGNNNTIYMKRLMGSRLQAARGKISRQKLTDMLNSREDRPVIGDKKADLLPETLKKWEYGENPVNIEWLPMICEALDCDIGYLVGMYPEKRREISDACKTTGLSERAVNRILLETTLAPGLPISENETDSLSILNTLLTSTEFWRIVHLLGGYVNAGKQGISRAAELSREYHLINHAVAANDSAAARDILGYKLQRAFSALLDRIDNDEGEVDTNDYH